MPLADKDRKATVDVIIPTFQPGAEFAKLLRGLALQVMQPDHVVVVNTEEKYWDRSFEKICPNLILHQIRKEEFDHGTVRHAAACESKADILVFMTQDAVPADEHLLENLTAPILRGEAQFSYARQLPREDAGVIEKITRSFNYPEESRIKSRKDLTTMGVKTFFCSNVCAAYDHNVYNKLGGFPRPVDFNEDMVLAGYAVEAGYRISYTAEARVFHSHNYSARQQYKRNYQIGISQVRFADLFSAYPSEQEGMKLVRVTARGICAQHKYPQLVQLVWQSGWKYLGYTMGKRKGKKMYRRTQ